MRILLADDESTLRTEISRVLVADGHEVVSVASGEEALERFKAEPFPFVVTDVFMGRMTGLDLMSQLKALDPDCVVVVMTGPASWESATKALRAGAYDVLVKPIDRTDLISAVVSRAAEKIALAAENRRYRFELQEKTAQVESLSVSLRDTASRDGLTGLYNHRFFREALEREIARGTRHGRAFSLLMVDLDHFKRFNDSFGHLAGDEALVRLGDVLRAHCRAGGVAARYGGEEFVVLVPEVSQDGAVIVAQRIRSAFRSAGDVGPAGAGRNRLTVSVGVASFPDDAADAKRLIDCAERALDAAKSAGRDRLALAVLEPAGHPLN